MRCRYWVPLPTHTVIHVPQNSWTWVGKQARHCNHFLVSFFKWFSEFTCLCSILKMGIVASIFLLSPSDIDDTREGSVTTKTKLHALRTTQRNFHLIPWRQLSTCSFWIDFIDHQPQKMAPSKILQTFLQGRNSILEKPDNPDGTEKSVTSLPISTMHN